MAKKDIVIKEGDILKEFPKNEILVLTYKKSSGLTYYITRDERRINYYLYKQMKTGFKFLKTRLDDPLFKECY